MGLLNDLYKFKYDGHEFEIHARTGFAISQYTLIINNKKADQISGLIGTFYLLGNYIKNGVEKNVKVKVKQKIFGTDYYFIDGDKEIDLKNISKKEM